MERHELKEAAQKALGLALELADAVIRSDVPREHFDEVLERLKEILGEDQHTRSGDDNST